eukprot:24294-Eustigmatos_ZCMA.PRE.1
MRVPCSSFESLSSIPPARQNQHGTWGAWVLLSVIESFMIHAGGKPTRTLLNASQAVFASIAAGRASLGSSQMRLQLTQFYASLRGIVIIIMPSSEAVT